MMTQNHHISGLPQAGTQTMALLATAALGVVPPPGGTPDYFGFYSNYTTSPQPMGGPSPRSPSLRPAPAMSPRLSPSRTALTDLAGMRRPGASDSKKYFRRITSTIGDILYQNMPGVAAFTLRNAEILPVDLNADGIVDIPDLLDFFQQWLMTGILTADLSRREATRLLISRAWRSSPSIGSDNRTTIRSIGLGETN